MASIPSISVIISTYNQPEWLEKVLWSYEQQSFKNFEVVIADDGSDESTRQLIEQMQGRDELSYCNISGMRTKGFKKR